MRDVAITGLGVISAIGLSAETFHREIMAGACGQYDRMTYLISGRSYDRRAYAATVWRMAGRV